MMKTVVMSQDMFDRVMASDFAQYIHTAMAMADAGSFNSVRVTYDVAPSRTKNTKPKVIRRRSVQRKSN